VQQRERGDEEAMVMANDTSRCMAAAGRQAIGLHRSPGFFIAALALLHLILEALVLLFGIV